MNRHMNTDCSTACQGYHTGEEKLKFKPFGQRIHCKFLSTNYPSPGAIFLRIQDKKRARLFLITGGPKGAWPFQAGSIKR
jgi:hypothetical protein